MNWEASKDASKERKRFSSSSVLRGHNVEAFAYWKASLGFEHLAAAYRWDVGGGQVKSQGTHASAGTPTRVLVSIP